MMKYLVLIGNEEIELPDEKAVEEGVRSGRIPPGTWIKERDVESEWESVEEKFPHLATQ